MRLSRELRGRTKKYASAIIRCYVKLPLGRDEVRVLGKQLLRSGIQDEEIESLLRETDELLAIFTTMVSKLRACLKTPAPRRVRARGLQETAEMAMSCRPGALTGRVFKQALRKSGI